MKIYYTYSAQLPDEVTNKISEIISGMGGSVKSRIRPSSYQDFNLKEAEDVYKNNVKQIKMADLVIADISYVSSGVGYEVSLALDEKKPVICLYNLKDLKNSENLIKSVPVNLKGNTSKYLILKEYDLTSLKKTLELAIKDAKSLADTKFILIIPPEIDRYLEWNVKEKGVSKAEITRQAVENMMKDDRAYMEYMKEFAENKPSNN